MMAQRLAGYGFVTAAFLMPVLGVVAPLGIAPLGGLLALATAPLVVRTGAMRRLPRAIVILPALLVVWGAISASWAIDPREALGGAAKLALSTLAGQVTVAAALEVEGHWRRRIGLALLVAVLLAGCVLIVEYLTGNGVTYVRQLLAHGSISLLRSSLGRGAVIVAMVAPAAIVLGLSHRFRWGLGALALVLVGLFLGDSLSTRLAVALAILAAVVSLLRPPGLLRAVAVATILLIVAIPMAAQRMPDPHHTFQNWRWLPMSSHHRMTIWGFTGQHIAEKPIWGWGMEASRSIPGADEEIQVWRYDPDGTRTNVGLREPLLPLHPHNAVLQVWLELGLPGAALLAAFLLAVLRVLSRIDPARRVERAAGLAAFVGTFVVATVSYGFWQSWWQASMWLAAALLALASRPAEVANTVAIDRAAE
ncbi:Lipid A core-O-antigen ligase [Magnetospirillum sp. LM-5]|uniref:O-antigen ligase family protein n=1 Tax=Magnetospirillum sp. LM-5 TaxID=2681466 RepID=UPI00137DA04E|nr:O-antigen ligase family protein [Magnetospirillum sp. LM-5]CAA7622525.1 Lipid A core-O-antigen ligase [Magnetospirillum sp. LM-5]